MLPVKSFSVSVFILKRDGGGPKVLLLRRTGYLAGLWCQVAGRIEPGEKAWQTAHREVREETRLELSELWSADICEQFYELDKECITLVPVFVGIAPTDAKVILNNDEHDAFERLSFDEAATRLSSTSTTAFFRKPPCLVLSSATAQLILWLLFYGKPSSVILPMLLRSS